MTTIKVRRGTATQWANAATVLAAGEPGLDTTNNVLKLGDGSTAWASLPVSNSGTYARLLTTDATSTAASGTLAAWHLTPVDATSASATWTLPAASSVTAGVEVAVKKADTTANTVTVSRAGSDLIFGTGSGSTTKTLTLAGEAVTFVSDGVSKWTIQTSDTPSGVLASTYAPITGSAAYATIANQVEGAGIAQRNASIYATNRTRFNATKFPTWLTALSAVSAGTRDAKLLCVGDSTTAGFGSSNTASPGYTGYPARLATLLNTYIGVPAARGLVVPDQSGNTDARWSATGNWGWGTSGSLGWVANRCDWQLSTPFAGTLTFADTGILADKFDVYYLTGGATGTITITATGGTPVVQSTVAANGWAKVTATAATASLSNTVSITGAGNNCHIVGIEPYLSTTRKIRVGNAGVGSARTGGWTTNPTTFGGVMGIKQYAPDLTIIALGINDATDGVVAGTYGTNIQTLATAAAVSGDVILTSMIPTDSSINAGANATNEPGYVSQLSGITAYAFVDVFTRAGSATAYQNLGFVYSDKIHGTDAGYKDIAQMIASGLMGL